MEQTIKTNRLFEKIKLAKDHLVTMSLPMSDYCTTLTKGIKFTATHTSKLMDTANGGYLKHGGLHRLFGGHSCVDANNWQAFGFDYPFELFKDFITSNGVPCPGVETAVNGGYIKASTAQHWGTMNIGKLGSAAIGVLDTALMLKKAKGDQSDIANVQNTIKGTVKFGLGISSGNIPLIIAGGVDLTLIVEQKLNANLQFDFDPVASLCGEEPAYI